MSVVRWDGWLRRPAFDAVAGWGDRPSSQAARRLAEAASVPYVTLEDGWLRSIRPGGSEMPLSLVVDWTGRHFDARTPSDCEALIVRSAGNADPNRLTRARVAIAALRDERISKYNHAPEISADAVVGHEPGQGAVLVVDQTWGDASIAGGLADEATFDRMLAAALEENPGRQVLVKTHPETTGGAKRGYLTRAAGDRIRRIDSLVNPWSLIETVEAVYVVSSQLGLEALVGGRRVVCFGAPCYAGWGLTDDRVAIPRRTARPTIDQLFAALYFDYARYVSPVDQSPTTFEATFDRLRSAREAYHARGREV